jgi:hypothetical protein
MMNLKLKTAAVVMLSALLGAPAVLPFGRTAAAQEADKEKKVADLDTELAKQMEVMDSGMKKLRRSLRKAESNKESLETIEKVHAAAVKAKDMTPAMASKIDAGKRAEWVAAYKKDMEATIKTIEQMRDAVKDGKNDEAVKLHATIKKQEDKGHEKYTEQ